MVCHGSLLVLPHSAGLGYRPPELNVQPSTDRRKAFLPALGDRFRPSRNPMTAHGALSGATLAVCRGAGQRQSDPGVCGPVFRYVAQHHGGASHLCLLADMVLAVWGGGTDGGRGGCHHRVRGTSRSRRLRSRVRALRLPTGEPGPSQGQGCGLRFWRSGQRQGRLGSGPGAERQFRHAAAVGEYGILGGCGRRPGSMGGWAWAGSLKHGPHELAAVGGGQRPERA